jgi:hypothetical protein
MRPVTRPRPQLALPVAVAALALLSVCGCRSGTGRVGAAPAAAQAALPPQGGDVALLASPDFVLRSQAAERLLAGGASSLPGLGAAGDLPVPALGGARDSATAPVVAAIMARLPDAEVQPLLASPHPSLRRAAAHELGQRDAWAPVPDLIEGLGDGDPRVREAAHAALRRLTGELADPAGSGDRRARWRAWWSEVGRARAQGAREPSAG